jgi:holo-[acyl-carrier protein] synthase
MAQIRAEHTTSSSLRIGVDLVRVADVARSMVRFGSRYAKRVFTPGERNYCGEDGRAAAEQFAARFAAKEATLKVLRIRHSDGRRAARVASR